jgi:hypothetical protein
MPATLQEISLAHADILLQLRLPHHPDFRENLEQNTSLGSNNGTVASE